ncbi:MAG: hypothetical protein V4678_02565 [Patescibacteria group bacterium]
MRQLFIVFSLIGSFIVFSLTINLFDTMFMFLLFGILPGRAEPLSANHMLTIYSVATTGVIGYAVHTQVIALAKLLFRLPTTTPARRSS